MSLKGKPPAIADTEITTKKQVSLSGHSTLTSHNIVNAGDRHFDIFGLAKFWCSDEFRRLTKGSLMT